MRYANTVRARSAWRFLLLAAVTLVPLPPALGQSSGVGDVRGTVQTEEGKPVGGFWLMIENPDLGMIYRKDVDPIGRFAFTDVYPGTYFFRISPYSYTVVKPSQIEVKADRTLDVTVVVARAPRSAVPAPPSSPHAPIVPAAAPAGSAAQPGP